MVAVDNPILVAVPEQITCDKGVAITVGDGLTVMVKLRAVPWQPMAPLVNVGVTVMVATRGDVPPLVAMKEGIPVELPALLAASPIAGLLLLQMYVVVPPVLMVAKVMAAVLVLLQTTWLPGLVT